jgi:hypothetical protein
MIEQGVNKDGIKLPSPSRSESFKYVPFKPSLKEQETLDRLKRNPPPIEPIKQWLTEKPRPQVELTDALIDEIAKHIQSAMKDNERYNFIDGGLVQPTDKDVYGQTNDK